MAKSMSAQNIVKPSVENITASAQTALRTGNMPPVHLWNPPFCGDLDMRIARDGTWFYQGTPIGRPSLVRLFSKILKRENDKYFLVTPVEKVGITVDDAPFVAIDFEVRIAGINQNLIFTSNVGDRIAAGRDHPIRVTRDKETGEPSPYVMVRAGLEALIDRKSFYRLVDIGIHADHGGISWFGVRSGGVFFPIIPSHELPEE